MWGGNIFRGPSIATLLLGACSYIFNPFLRVKMGVEHVHSQMFVVVVGCSPAR